MTQHQRNLAVEDANQAKNYWETQTAVQEALQAHTQYQIATTTTKTKTEQLQGVKLDLNKQKLINVGKGISNRTQEAKNAGLIVGLNSTIDGVKFATAQRGMQQLTYVEQLKGMDLQLASLRQTNLHIETEITQQGIMGRLERPKLELTKPTTPALDRLLANANRRKVHA